MTTEDFQFIHVGPHGTFAPSGEQSTTPDHIDALFAKMRQDKCRQMVIYFHGGLVGEKSGLQTARALDPIFQAINAQPVFFIWETGPWETIRDNLPKILKTKLVSNILKYVLSQVAKRWVGVDIAGKGPGETMTLEEIEAELEKDRPFDTWDAASAAQGGAKGGPEPLSEASLAEAEAEMAMELALQMQARADELEAATIAAADNELLSSEIRQEAAEVAAAAKGFDLLLLVRLATMIGIRVLRRYMNGLDHGLYPTVVEETLREVGLDGVGKFLWEGMKDKAGAMWAPDPQPPPADFTKRRVGAYFLERLAEYATENPPFAVDLVGHSAGSIVICELLKHASQRIPQLKFGRIALLAPGARMDLFVEEIVKHPERYERLRMYTMLDELELQDAIASKLYPLSLLFFVSGVLEDPSATPLSGLARCLSGNEAYSQGDALLAHQFFFADGEDRLVLAVTDDDAPPGLRSNATHHGDFDNVIMSDGIDGETVLSLQVFLQRETV